MNPRIIVIAGTTSNSGKTTLLCELLRQLSANQQWEAIKLTRGHYRSCGKDPEACCVSDLLGTQPTVRSGREATYSAGKDTARYWDAGAANVHWVIATNAQVEAGIREAMSRVTAPNVLIEGTSSLPYVHSQFTILAIGSDWSKPKASVRRALIEQNINALYLSTETAKTARSNELLTALLEISPAIDPEWLARLPIFSDYNLSHLVTAVLASERPETN